MQTHMNIGNNNSFRSIILKAGFIPIGIGIYSICCAVTYASLFDDIQDLSTDTQVALVAHYDGRTGVITTGNIVESWIPVDGNGSLIRDMTVSSTQRGNGAANLITYNINGQLIFNDPSVAADGRYLSGSLKNAGANEFTIFWLGHYKANAPFATSGTYAYNIGLNNISHQRDDGGGGFRVEMYNGTTYAGDDITAYDGIDTVWSTVITANTHDTYANGVNLNIIGTPSNNVTANANIIIGAYGESGYDLVGNISQIIIFESALNERDRSLIENYLGNLAELPAQPDPITLSTPELTINNGIGSLRWKSEAHLLSSNDLEEWSIEAESTSPMSWEIGKEKEFFRLATNFTEIPRGIVLRTRFASDTYREIEYHVDTGELFFHGEQYHGLDYYGGSDDFWWCTLNSASQGSGLLDFLMDHNDDADTMKAIAIANGWTTYSSDNYSFLTMEPLPSQKTYINHTAPASPGQTNTTDAYTTDYDKIANDKLLYVLYRNVSSGTAYVAVGGPSLNSSTSQHPPGDGSSNRDNGVRIDIALKTTVPMTQINKLKLINKFTPLKPIYDNNTKAYFYEHGEGF